MRIKTAVRFVPALAVFCIIAGCKSDSGAAGRLVSHGACKGSQANPLAASPAAGSGEECIEYTYDGQSALSLRHVNAGFNCCPGRITAEVKIGNGLIEISEKEEQAGCHCLCLFDVDYLVEDLKPGVYLIRIRKAADPDSLLEGTVDLLGCPSGRHCVERSTYPWGT